MSEPISPEAGKLGPPERLHPLFLLSGLGRALRGLAGAYAFVAYLVVSGQLATAIIVGLGGLAFAAVSMFAYWQSFQFRVGASEIRIDHGILSRTHRSIPFDRITDVDIIQGPLARMLGLAEVKFETGGGGGKDEGVLRAVTLDRAEELRRLVRSRRSAAPEPVQATAGEEPPVFAMGIRRLMLAGVFNFSLALFAGLLGLTQTFGDVFGFDPFSERFWRDLLAAGSPLADLIRSHRLVAIAAGIIVLLTLGLLTGIVRTLLRDYGFRIDRTDAGLRRRRGLFTLTDVTLPVRRVQAAIVASGPVRAAFGWSELKLQNLAAEEGGGGDHVVAPLADPQEVDSLLANLGWRPLQVPIDWRRVSSAYVSALTVGASPLLAIAALQLLIFPLAALPLAAVYAFAAGSRWLSWTRTAYALDGDRLLIRTGWWRRRLIVLPLSKIQSIELRENAVSRLFSICSLFFGVAGGGGFSAHMIPALKRETARQLRDQLLDSQP